MATKTEDKENEEPKRRPKVNFNHSIAGAFAGFFSRLIGQPLDVVKTRFQLQTEPITKNSNSKYQGIIQAMILIFKEEGVNGLWRAHVPAQMLSIGYGLIQFQLYDVLKTRMYKHKIFGGYNNNKNSLVHFVSGSVSGCGATIATYPFDIVRTRLIAQGNNREYSNFINGFLQIYKTEGILGYWRGLSPAIISSGPSLGCQFAFFEFFKNTMKYFDVFREKNERRINSLGNLTAGVMAGFSTKIILYPFDLARKRMQLQSFQYARVGFGANFWCKGLFSCFVNTVKKEGITGSYKGLTASLAKSSLTSGIYFMAFEETLKFLDGSKYARK